MTELMGKHLSCTFALHCELIYAEKYRVLQSWD